MGKRREILRDLLAADRAGDHRGDDRMAKWKLQRRGRQRHAVALANRLHSGNLLKDLCLRRRIIVHRIGHRAGRQDARIIGAADDDADPALGTAVKLAIQHILFEQRISHGDQEEIDIEQVEITGDGAHGVEAGTDAFDHALDRKSTV